MPDPLISTQNAAAPALSATSDMPVITPPAPPAPDTPAESPAETADDAAAADAGEDQAATEETPAGTTEAPTEPPAEPEDRRRPRFGERMAELTQQRKAAEERERQAREDAARTLKLLEEERAARIAAEQRQKSSETPAVDPQVDARPTRPTRDGFETPEAYDEALGEHEIRLVEWSARQAARLTQDEIDKRAAEKQAADAKAAEEQRQKDHAAASVKAWTDRRAKAIERLPDYVEIAERDDVPISASMAAIITTQEAGPDIAYYLGNHPDQARRIAEMVLPGQVFPPGHQLAGQPVPDIQRQIFELGWVAAQLEAPKAQPTRAPRPIRPLGSNSAARAKDPAEMTIEEYAALRTPQLQDARRSAMLGTPSNKPN